MRQGAYRWRFGLCLSTLLLTFVWNEYLVYFTVIAQCKWPETYIAGGKHHVYKVLFIADTHLLGSKEGHWFDKLRREWQMSRSFQVTNQLFSSDAIFVMGDLFDEGKWCSDDEFSHYIRRFKELFPKPPKTQMFSLVGNHDIGFHYTIDWHKLQRFKAAFNAPSVRSIFIGRLHFVLLNSMAFEGDNCDMCREAEKELNSVAAELQCMERNNSTCFALSKPNYSRPILLQHFPMYRTSDHDCSGLDAASSSEKEVPFRERWDCLSKSATKKLMKLLKPRAIVSGHTHHGCHRIHGDGTPEWTVASYSWRNKKQPSFLLGSITEQDIAISRCFLPNENTVLVVYVIGFVSAFLCLVTPAAFCSKLFSSNVKWKKKGK